MTSEESLWQMAQVKEVKVKIPLAYHVRLHTLKVLRGQSISATVEIALSEYFAKLAEAGEVLQPAQSAIAAPRRAVPL